MFDNNRASTPTTRNRGSRDADTVDLRSRVEQLLRTGTVELPVLPTIAADLRRLIEREADTGSLVQVIEREPAAAAALMQFANSARFAGLADVDDLHHAINRLGRTAVSNVVLSVAAKAAFSGTTELLWYYRSLWVHSQMTALAARRLAAHTAVAPDVAFLAGLLHDAGKLVVLRGLSAVRETRPGQPSLDGETTRSLLDGLHTPAGERLADAWTLPAGLRAAITQHHDERAEGPHARLVAIVQVANAMAHELGASLQPEPGPDAASSPAARLLGFDADTLKAVAIEVEREFNSLPVVL